MGNPPSDNAAAGGRDGAMPGGAAAGANDGGANGGNNGNGGGANGSSYHMASFNYAYNCIAVMEWLFQTR